MDLEEVVMDQGEVVMDLGEVVMDLEAVVMAVTEDKLAMYDYLGEFLSSTKSTSACFCF